MSTRGASAIRPATDRLGGSAAGWRRRGRASTEFSAHSNMFDGPFQSPIGRDTEPEASFRRTTPGLACD